MKPPGTADVILPGSRREQPHHDDLILQFAVDSFANYSPPVFLPDPNHPGEWGDPDPAHRTVHRKLQRRMY